jgi:hypothetical protein
VISFAGGKEAVLDPKLLNRRFSSAPETFKSASRDSNADNGRVPIGSRSHVSESRSVATDAATFDETDAESEPDCASIDVSEL